MVSFVIGVLFSGTLALAARGRGFEKLSLKLFTALGGGLAAYTAIGLSGAFSRRSLDTAGVNLLLLTNPSAPGIASK